MRLPGAKTFASTLRNRSRKFPGRTDPRHAQDLLFPDVRPGFGISRQDSVFTIGSCFARNVEEVLLAEGITVPTASFAAPREEAPGRPNRILNQYNPGTMLQCVKAMDEEMDEAGLYRMDDGRVLDCLLATGSRPVSPQRARERRGQVRDLYISGLARSEFVVITLGLVEAWYDRADNIYLNEAPPRKLLDTDPGRFELHQLGVPEARDMVFQMLERLLENGRRKVILTVSPVPLQVTFAGGDAVVQNAYSKAVLRVVADLAAREFEDVDYFPSYEIVTSGGLQSVGDDNVHVRPAVVEKVVRYMVSRYIQ